MTGPRVARLLLGAALLGSCNSPGEPIPVVENFDVGGAFTVYAYTAGGQCMGMVHYLYCPYSQPIDEPFSATLRISRGTLQATVGDAVVVFDGSTYSGTITDDPSKGTWRISAYRGGTGSAPAVYLEGDLATGPLSGTFTWSPDNTGPSYQYRRGTYPAHRKD